MWRGEARIPLGRSWGRAYQDGSASPGRGQTRGVRPLGISPSGQFAEPSKQLVERLRRLPHSPLPHRKGILGLAVAVDDHELDLLQLGVADPASERLVALVDVGAKSVRVQSVAQRACLRTR